MRSSSTTLLLLVVAVLATATLLPSAHGTPSAGLLNKAGKSLAKAGKRAGRAGGAAVKAGVQAGTKAGGAAVAAGIKAAGQAAGTAGGKAKRASQRTWEAARAARAASKAARLQQQQQAAVLVQQQEAHEVTATVFPAPSAAAAAVCASDVCIDLTADTDAEDDPAAAARVQEVTALPPPSEQQQQEQQQQGPASSKGRGWSYGWVVVTYCVAAALGWMLRGRPAADSQTGTTQQHAQRPAVRQNRYGKSGGRHSTATPSSSSSSSSSAARRRLRQPKQQEQQLPCAPATSGGGGDGVVQPAVSRCSSSGSSSGSSSSDGASNAVQGQPAQPSRLQESSGGAGTDKPRKQPVAQPSSTAPAAAPAGEAPATAAEGRDTDSDAGSYVVCDSDDEDLRSAVTGSTMQQPAQKHAPDAAQAGPSFAADPHRPAAPRADEPATTGSHSLGASAGGSSMAGRSRQRVFNSQGALVPYGRRSHAVARRMRVQHRDLILHPQHTGHHAVQVVGQQTLVINHNKLVISDEVAALLMPVARCVQEVCDSLRPIAQAAKSWMGWSTAQEAEQRLAAQQELLERAGHFGQVLGLVASAAVALRAGRLWEVHQTCQASMLQRPSGWRGWAHQMTGTQTVVDGLSYVNCCAQQMGLYAAGLFVLYMLLRLSWSGSSAYRRGASGRPSNSFQLDLLVVKGGICSWLGAHVVHCLGGAWLPWLAGWLLWCACQLWLNLWIVSRLQSSLSVMLVALVLPLAMSWVPFRPGAILVQGWLAEAVPALAWVPRLDHLLPF